jgi:hypothetical protein
MCKSARWYGLTGVIGGGPALPPIGSGHRTGCGCRRHIHYSVGSPQQYPPEKAIAILTRPESTGAMSSTRTTAPSSSTVVPERFVAELRPYRKTCDFETWAVERELYRDPEP